MMRIDEKVDRDRLKQFAAQLVKVPVGIRRTLEECLVFDQNVDFYYGQIAAVGFAHQLAESKLAPDANETGGDDWDMVVALRVVIAILAEQILNMEEVKMEGEPEDGSQTDG